MPCFGHDIVTYIASSYINYNTPTILEKITIPIKITKKVGLSFPEGRRTSVQIITLEDELLCQNIISRMLTED